MIKDHDLINMKKIMSEYSEVHDRLLHLETETEKIKAIKEDLVLKLDGIREKENELINKINSSLGRNITPTEIYSIIKNDIN
jgi:hypothetical protein